MLSCILTFAKSQSGSADHQNVIPIFWNYHIFYFVLCLVLIHLDDLPSQSIIRVMLHLPHKGHKVAFIQSNWFYVGILNAFIVSNWIFEGMNFFDQLYIFQIVKNKNKQYIKSQSTLYNPYLNLTARNSNVIQDLNIVTIFDVWWMEDGNTFVQEWKSSLVATWVLWIT